MCKTLVEKQLTGRRKNTEHVAQPTLCRDIQRHLLPAATAQTHSSPSRSYSSCLNGSSQKILDKILPTWMDNLPAWFQEPLYFVSLLPSCLDLISLRLHPQFRDSGNAPQFGPRRRSPLLLTMQTLDPFQPLPPSADCCQTVLISSNP